MENIVPVSDMRYYNQTLSDVTVGSQVILTRNGKAEYAVVDIEEWRRTKATLRLFEERQKGYRSLANEKTYTPDELANELGIDVTDLLDEANWNDSEFTFNGRTWDFEFKYDGSIMVERIKKENNSASVQI